MLLIVGQYSRKAQADSIGFSIRNSFLIGDNRSVVKALNGSLHAGYIYIEVFDISNTKVFQVGDEKNHDGLFIKKYVFMDFL